MTAPTPPPPPRCAGEGESENPTRLPHAWDVSPDEARAIQARLRPLVRQTPSLALDQIHTVAGVDVAYVADGERADGSVAGRAAVSVWSLPNLIEIERATAVQAVSFPYVPGLLSFREAPAALAALARLGNRPDLLLCDGQGYAHPRRFGLACHLGVFLDCPSVGCAKTRLIGTYDEPGDARGAWSPLRDGDEVIGAVVRTRAGTRPVYVSVGHRVDLATAIAVVLRCARAYRLPEPLRAADHLTRV
ncbi:MAG TPA: deoxyribonuclease V [Ktedonobacterales bacterium]